MKSGAGLLFVPLCLLFGGFDSAGAAQATASKQAQPVAPATGNTSNQSIDVQNPYCDAYLPYSFSGSTKNVTLVIPPTIAKNISTTSLREFLAKNQTTTDPLVPDGSFADPGYPIFGDPKSKFVADGSDVARLLKRLVADPSKVQPVALCPPIVQTTPKATTTPDENYDYVLIHVVHWKRVAGVYETDSSDWYLFNKSDGKAAHRQYPFKFHPVVNGKDNLRVFGSNKVFFLAIHLAPSGESGAGTLPTAEYQSFSNNVKISYKLSVTDLVPANIQDLKAILGVVVGASPGAGTPKSEGVVNDSEIADYQEFLKTLGERPYDGFYVAAKLENLNSLPVQISATMNAELPKAGTVTGDAAAHFESSKFWTDVKPVKPASGAASPASGTAASGCSTALRGGNCSESLSVQNEGLYWWDFSVGIPFVSTKQLQYDSTNTGQITTQTVSKYSAYAFLVLSPWKEDIVSPPSLGIPHFLVGLPFTGAVLNHPFVGAGETFNLAKFPKVGPKLAKVMPLGLRFYAGLVESKEYGPKPPMGNVPPSSRWVGKLQYGIEFSIRDIAAKLASSTKPSGSKSTSAK